MAEDDHLYKKSLFLIRYFISVSLSAILLAELILWLCFPISENSLSITQKYQPNMPGLKNNITYTQNQYGFRSLSMRTKEKGSRTVRIICIGASTTGQGSQNTEDTWSGILEQKLNEIMSKSNIPVEVAAWGIGGKKVWDGYLYCAHELSKFEPDIVVNLWGINDLAGQGGPNYSYSGKEKKMTDLRNALVKKESKKNGWKSHFKTTLLKYSQIYRRLVHIRMRRTDKTLLAIKQVLAGEVDKLLSKRQSEYRRLPFKENISRNPDPILEFTDGIEALILLLKKQGIETVVMSQPILWKKDMSSAEKDVLWFSFNTKEGPVRASGQWLETEMSRYNQIQEKLAENYRLSYVPLDSLIPKTLNIFYDDCHFTDNGNRAVAQAAYPEALKLVKKVAEKRKLII